MSTEKEFVWTEELAKEYGRFCLEKHSPIQWEDFKKTKRGVFFTTEDGKQIFKDDSCWTVDLSDLSIIADTATCIPIPSWFDSYKPFSTKQLAEEYVIMNKSCKQLAEEYVIMNKSCLSLKEVITNSPIPYYDVNDLAQNPHYQKLRELVKEKIKF